MKWFEHHCDAHENRKLRKLKRTYGMAGIGQYWTLMEIIGKEIGRPNNEDGYLKSDYDLALLADDLMFDSTDEVRVFLGFLAEISAIDKDAWETGRVSCPKLVQRCDEYTRKALRQCPSNTPSVSGECPDSVPTMSGVCPDNIPTESGQGTDNVPSVSGLCPPRREEIRREDKRREETPFPSPAHACTREGNTEIPTTTTPESLEEKETTTTTGIATFRIWEECTGRLITEHEGHRLDDLLEEFGDEFVVAAVREAAGNGRAKVNLKYVQAILERWNEEGRPTPTENRKNGNNGKNNNPAGLPRGKIGPGRYEGPLMSTCACSTPEDVERWERLHTDRSPPP